jgi:hypothetical protein
MSLYEDEAGLSLCTWKAELFIHLYEDEAGLGK